MNLLLWEHFHVFNFFCFICLGDWEYCETVEVLTSPNWQVDVFSFGIVMWEILTGEEPYANMHYGAIIGMPQTFFCSF